MKRSGGVTDVSRVLRAAEAHSPVEAVAGVARELGMAFGAVAVSFLIHDLSGRALVRLAHVPLTSEMAGRLEPAVSGVRRDEEESATLLPFHGGPAEQALRTQQVQVCPPADANTSPRFAGHWRVLAPVTERGESVGVLELFLPEEPQKAVLSEIAELAHLLAFVVIANRRHTDVFEWGQRTREFTLSAEIQQRLLPDAGTCEAAAFTLAGWLEPAESIGGDTFDYSLARNVLHLSLTDAMGHGVDAALTASLCMGGLRGSRRAGCSLVEQASAANTALADYALKATREDFVTGLLGRLELPTGQLSLVNAGHVPPFLLRDGTARALDLPVNLPLGIVPDTTYTSTELHLQPGDRLVLLTDGMLERNVAGIDVPAALAQTQELHPREVVRALADSALAATGHALQDDATILCVDWHGGHEESRSSVSGADASRASRPL